VPRAHHARTRPPRAASGRGNLPDAAQRKRERHCYSVHHRPSPAITIRSLSSAHDAHHCARAPTAREGRYPRHHQRQARARGSRPQPKTTARPTNSAAIGCTKPRPPSPAPRAWGRRRVAFRATTARTATSLGGTANRRRHARACGSTTRRPADPRRPYRTDDGDARRRATTRDNANPPRAHDHEGARAHHTTTRHEQPDGRAEGPPP